MQHTSARLPSPSAEFIQQQPLDAPPSFLMGVCVKNLLHAEKAVCSFTWKAFESKDFLGSRFPFPHLSLASLSKAPVPGVGRQDGFGPVHGEHDVPHAVNAGDSMRVLPPHCFSSVLPGQLKLSIEVQDRSLMLHGEY